MTASLAQTEPETETVIMNYRPDIEYYHLKKILIEVQFRDMTNGSSG